MPDKETKQSLLTRRQVLGGSVSAASLVAFGCQSQSAGLNYSSRRPLITHGVQSGDIGIQGGVIWSRADRNSIMQVEWSTTDSFRQPQKLAPVPATAESDFAAKVALPKIPHDQTIFYRVQFAAADNDKAVSESVIGHFQSIPIDKRSIRFAWSGDTAGQGWGIDPDRGGMKTYAAIQSHNPDFFIHCGDTVYADGPIKPEQRMRGGEVWRNRISDGVEKVAESLDEFRGRWRYNLTDPILREFNANLSAYYQWDDHDVVNNWSPSKTLLDDDRYTEKSLPTLVARGKRAFYDMLPTMPDSSGHAGNYRKVHYGPLLDVFFLDFRTFRGANDYSFTGSSVPPSSLLGNAQLEWLISELKSSSASWKVIAANQPLGLTIWDDWKTRSGVEAVADGSGASPVGREQEIAVLLRAIKKASLKNIVWVCGDVHYTASHHYHPDRAAIRDFDPFWEFVSGPLHAGNFGHAELDMTFGPEVVFSKAPKPEDGVNLPPAGDTQFFGLVDIDGTSEALTVRVMDRSNKELFSKTLHVAGGES